MSYIDNQAEQALKFLESRIKPLNTMEEELKRIFQIIAAVKNQTEQIQQAHRRIKETLFGCVDKTYGIEQRKLEMSAEQIFRLMQANIAKLEKALNNAPQGDKAKIEEMIKYIRQELVEGKKKLEKVRQNIYLAFKKITSQLNLQLEKLRRIQMAKIVNSDQQIQKLISAEKKKTELAEKQAWEGIEKLKLRLESMHGQLTAELQTMLSQTETKIRDKVLELHALIEQLEKAGRETIAQLWQQIDLSDVPPPSPPPQLSARQQEMTQVISDKVQQISEKLEKLTDLH